MFVKKGDKVRVIAGKDKGTEAVVLKALPKVNKVIVEGVGMIKKHQKPNTENPQGAIVEKEAPIHVSNVQVLDKNGVAGRVGYKVVDGKKYVTAKNQAKCLINHEGKEKHNGKSFKRKYTNEVIPALTEKFNYTSVMAVPKVEKIVLNMGVGDAVSNAKNLEKAAAELALISGQKPLITKAKKSIAGFRLREGVAIGAKVTLRGERMYEFLDKLVSVSLPRVRDFHGVPTKSFDGRGNYTLGVKEQLIFPEISFDDVDKVRGLDIVIVTTANTDEESRELLKGLGMPFAK